MDPHYWLNTRYPRKGVCEECGRERKTHYAFRFHKVKEHTFDRADYRELCERCHGKDHREQGVFLGKEVSAAHRAAIGDGIRRAVERRRLRRAGFCEKRIRQLVPR